jgi:uncharacterized protein YjbI with pentapeptide repeats
LTGKENIQRLTWIVLIVIGMGIVAIAVWTAYLRIENGIWPEWTGFGVYTGTLTKDHRGKTLWDWMNLLIVPVLLAAGAILFNRSQRKNEQIRVADQQREEALQNYLDKMSELLLEKGLVEKKDGDNEPIANVAQVRTVTTFKMLDTSRLGILLQFLRDTKLANFILENASLTRIDISNVNLSSLNLSGADLMGTNLSKANLAGADLSGADLFGANLSEANLAGADLSGANLQLADLKQADLLGAKLIDADLSRADLSGAYLSGSILSAPKPQAQPNETVTVVLGGVGNNPATLAGADFTSAHFGPTKVNERFGVVFISGALLSGVDFKNVKGLNDAHFKGAIDDGTAQWPDDFDFTDAGLITPGDQIGMERAPEAARPPSELDARICRQRNLR